MRGSLALTSDLDIYSFSGTRGQTIYFMTDSAATTATINMRLACSSDTSSVGSARFLAFNQFSFPAFAFTLPTTGTYYLRLSLANATPSTYRILTAFDTPSAGDRARDHRDAFAAHSDDGTVWSTPVRISDSDPWYDCEFPEITADGTGAVHCFWHDFRDDAVCGAESYEYIVASGDGGNTWGPNRRLSDAQSFWSFEACGSANQGDYQGVTSNGASVYYCWADSRLGDPDVFSEADTYRIHGGCAADQNVPAGSTQVLSFPISNSSDVGRTYRWTLGENLNWITGVTPAASGTVNLAAGGNQTVTVTLAIPALCPNPNGNALRFTVGDLDIPGRADTCVTKLRCVSSTGVDAAGASLFLAPPAPNPSPGIFLLRYSLSRPGPASLAIFAANGARVRTLADGRGIAGIHEVAWDRRDGAGRRMHAGVYYAVLEAEGNRLRRPVVLTP